MRRVALPLAALAAVALALPVVAISSASADETVPTSRLMTKADAKAFGGLHKPKKQHWGVGRYDPATMVSNGVCLDANGQPLTYPDAAGWTADAELKGKGYRSLSQTVRVYASAQAAASAWKDLKAAAAACAPATGETLEVGNPREYYEVTQTMPTLSDAVAVKSVSVAHSTDERINGSRTVTYDVYRLSGTSISEVTLYFNGGKAMTDAQTTAVNELSASLLARWNDGAATATPSATATPTATASPTAIATPSATASPSASASATS